MPAKGEASMWRMISWRVLSGVEATDEVAVAIPAAAEDGTVEVVTRLTLVEACGDFLLGAVFWVFLGTTTGLEMLSGMSINHILRSNTISLLPSVSCRGMGAHFPGIGCSNPSDHVVCTTSFDGALSRLKTSLDLLSASMS